MIKLNILIIAMLLALNVYAQDEASDDTASDDSSVTDQTATDDASQDSNDNIVIKKTIDYKTQVGLLRPKLGDKKIAEMPTPWLAYVKTIEGNALIKRYNKAGDIILTFQAEEKDLLKNGDIVDLGVNGRVQLELKNKEFVNLGPSTILRIEQQSTYTLLVGSVRIRSPRAKEPRDILVYAPNVNALSRNSSSIDIVVKYDDKQRTTTLVCFVGSLMASGVRDSREQKGFEKDVIHGEKLNIITTNEKNKEVYIAADTEKLSMDSKREILESFYSSPDQVGSWEYTKLSTSFFRFAASFEYARFKEVSNTAYANFTFGYVPLIYLGSIFYLEPYFHVSFANPFNLFFYRVGTALQVNPIGGLYLGTGGGAFWIDKDTGRYGADFTLHIGYTFAEKSMGFIDGFRVAYFASQASNLHEKAYMFSVIANFGYGRELY